MKYLVACALVFLASAAKAETEAKPETVEIPLDEIWAHGIPGTKKIIELDSVKFDRLTWSPKVQEIAKVLLSRSPREGESAGPAFIVRGTDKQALKNVHSVFTESVEPKTEFPADTDLTLVFFTEVCGQYVHIKSVKRSESAITIEYQFVAHSTRDSTAHFALIPLGKLSEGEYEVKIEQLPSLDMKGKEAPPMEKPERYVCHDATFSVHKEKK